MSKKLNEYVKTRPPHVQAAQLLADLGKEVPRTIEYIMTLSGPVPLEVKNTNYDYEHYREKQIRPLAEVVLDYLGLNFDQLFGGGQLDFFV